MPEPAIVIKKSEINGKGIFANRDFQSGEKILDWKNNLRLALNLNHSCTPNSRIQEGSKHTWVNDVLLAGSAGIKKGEEITCDYSITRWKKLWRQTVSKNCGCPKCITKAA